MQGRNVDTGKVVAQNGQWRKKHEQSLQAPKAKKQAARNRPNVSRRIWRHVDLGG